MESVPKYDFGSRYRVRRSPLTDSRGLAGLVGTCYGFTTPAASQQGTDHIGDLKSDQDIVVNLNFEERKTSFWFTEDLIEFVDHGAGFEMKLNNVPKRWVKQSDGEWKEYGLVRDNFWKRLFGRWGLK